MLRSCAIASSNPQDDSYIVILYSHFMHRRITDREEMEKTGYIYFMSNKKDGVIYIGVTSNLIKRVYEHKMGVVKGFTKKYNLKKLVYFEIFDDIETAIMDEKKLKNISRAKKIEIIERMNLGWRDLYEEIAS